ncbi:MAG: ComF family protein [Syntrophobacteraceae bacterium]|jgi:ComF family protein|nr:ComF family protein [Syntrophobacteraceae bacterium]
MMRRRAGFRRLGGRILDGLWGIRDSLLDLAFPRKCTGCEGIGLDDREGCWCSECWSSVQWIQPPLCTLCGKPFPKSPASSDHLCGECLLSTFHFDRARSAAVHAGVARDSIHALKFGGHLHHVPALAELLVDALEPELESRAAILIPVPLHTRRLRQRGFNQAGLLALELGHRIDLPVRFDVLRRKQWTEPQTRLHREDRLSNVRNAFEVRIPGAIEGRGVLLLDDVHTTGTTLSECARELKAAGAGEVVAWTVTRSVPELSLMAGDRAEVEPGRPGSRQAVRERLPVISSGAQRSEKSPEIQ